MHRTKFAVVHDKSGSVKEYLTKVLGKALRVPHAFVVAKGKIMWHQNHSADSPTYISLMEENVERVLNDKPIVHEIEVHGTLFRSDGI